MECAKKTPMPIIRRVLLQVGVVVAFHQIGLAGLSFGSYHKAEHISSHLLKKWTNNSPSTIPYALSFDM